MDTGLTEERNDRREQNKGKERRNNNKYERKGIRLNREYSLGVQASPDRGCVYRAFGFRGEHASSGLVDGIRDVLGSLGMVRCVQE